jgi:uncharacterized membrane protein (UPF0127 family)
MRQVHVVIDASRHVLAVAEMADGPATRMVGLLGRDSLDRGAGLILDPCRLIHTAFMRFAIDAVFIDRQLRVTRVARHVRPFRLAWGGWAAHYTLELAAGALDDVAIASGMQLRFEPFPSDAPPSH